MFFTFLKSWMSIRGRIVGSTVRWSGTEMALSVTKRYRDPVTLARLCILLAAFARQQQSSVVAAEAVWPARPKIFATWSFAEQVCWTYSGGLVISASWRREVPQAHAGVSSKHHRTLGLCLSQLSPQASCKTGYGQLLPWGWQWLWALMRAQQSWERASDLPKQLCNCLQQTLAFCLRSPFDISFYHLSVLWLALYLSLSLTLLSVSLPRSLSAPLLHQLIHELPSTPPLPHGRCQQSGLRCGS